MVHDITCIKSYQVKLCGTRDGEEEILERRINGLSKEHAIEWMEAELKMYGWGRIKVLYMERVFNTNPPLKYERIALG